MTPENDILPVRDITAFVVDRSDTIPAAVWPFLLVLLPLTSSRSSLDEVSPLSLLLTSKLSISLDDDESSPISASDISITSNTYTVSTKLILNQY